MAEKQTVQCPYCGHEAPVTRREMEYLNENEECTRMCISCRKTFTIYFFNGIFCTYSKY